MPCEKQFDPDLALEAAQNTFWANGYDATSLTDLLSVMGIQKGSFYATFGSKRDLFLQTLGLFVEERFTHMETMLASASPRQALLAHVQSIGRIPEKNACPLGCFLVNVAVELAPKDEEIQKRVCQAFERQVGLYRRVLDAAVAQGELSEAFDSLQVARTLFTLIVGLNVLSRAGMPTGVTDAVRMTALALIA
jgi:TetR/AcrR family transcriptional regulator, transcriptional repressor for nem operon